MPAKLRTSFKVVILMIAKMESVFVLCSRSWLCALTFTSRSTGADRQLPAVSRVGSDGNARVSAAFSRHFGR